MPEFCSPFSGLASDRKLSKEELVRAVRFMVAAEYEAIQLYMQLAESDGQWTGHRSPHGHRGRRADPRRRVFCAC